MNRTKAVMAILFGVGVLLGHHYLLAVGTGRISWYLLIIGAGAITCGIASLFWPELYDTQLVHRTPRLQIVVAVAVLAGAALAFTLAYVCYGVRLV